jgi:ligand-binding sensor domain-containing protein
MKSLPENSVLPPRRTNTTVIPCGGLILLYLLGCICAFQIRSLDVSQYPIHLGCTGGFSSREATATAQASDGYLWLTSSPGLFRFDGLGFVKWKTVPANVAFEPGPSRAQFQKTGGETRSTHDERA